jgi:sortase (surface protein transpeptidase)
LAASLIFGRANIVTSSFSVTHTPIPVATPQPVIINSLSIPKIGISAQILPVGQNDDGRMGVPPGGNNVGWWKFGAKPGEPGSTVLAGHYKMDSGEPGIFFRLNELILGDEIKIRDNSGQELVFEIVRKEIYKENEFPLNEVFLGDRVSKMLNLITCTGTYIKELKDYSHRLVIYSRLKDKKI